MLTTPVNKHRKDKTEKRSKVNDLYFWHAFAFHFYVATTTTTTMDELFDLSSGKFVSLELQRKKHLSRDYA